MKIKKDVKIRKKECYFCEKVFLEKDMFCLEFSLDKNINNDLCKTCSDIFLTFLGIRDEKIKISDVKIKVLKKCLEQMEKMKS